LEVDGQVESESNIKNILKKQVNSGFLSPIHVQERKKAVEDKSQCEEVFLNLSLSLSLSLILTLTLSLSLNLSLTLTLTLTQIG